MPTPRDQDRMNAVLPLIKQDGIVSAAALARALRLPYHTMNQWLLRNGLDLPMRRSMAPTIDPYEELRRAIAAPGAQAAWSRKHGINRGEIWKTLNGQMKIPPVMLAALGLRPVVTYERTRSSPAGRSALQQGDESHG